MPPKRGRKKNENSATASESAASESTSNKKEQRRASKRTMRDSEEAEVENSGKKIAKPKGKRERTLKVVLEDDITTNNSNTVKDDMDESSKKSKSPRKNKKNDVDQVPSKRAKTNEKDTKGVQDAETIYQFKATDINGKEVSLETYKGHVCIIVNVASKCGHTKSNYEQFVELFENYSEEKGLRILAFPCNQFGKQEPGDSQKICEFVEKRNVKFDMFEKIEVNGKNAHPLWKFLTDKIQGPKGKNIEWNFTKFIIDKDGKVMERHKSAVKPKQLVASLEKYW